MIKNNENEQIDDLLVDGRKIIQSKNGYHFTSDSVRLAKFVKFLPKDKICEFCAGSGIIGILLAIDGAKNITQIELQKSLFDLAQKNVKLNKFENEISVFNFDLKQTHEKFGFESFDSVVCNPPFEKYNKNLESNENNIAKFELNTNLEEIVKESAKILKFGGKLFSVIPSKRLFEFNEYLTKNNFAVKKCKMFFPKNNVCDTVYVCAQKGAKQNAIIEKI